jgi:Undecaprenyl-phosphate glucose phosphotransferase
VIKRSSQTLASWFFVCDLAAVASAWVGAYFVRFSGYLPVTKEQPPIDFVYNDLPLAMLLASIAFRVSGNYQVHRLRRLREEVWAVFKGSALAVLFVMAAGFYMQDPYVSRGAMSLYGALVFTLVLVGRRATWWFVHFMRRRGHNPSFCLIVGTGRVARKTANAIRAASWMGLRNVGFVEDNPTRWTSDLDILGVVDDLPGLIDRYGIEHVFIALPMNRYHESRRVFDVLSQKIVEIRLVADVPAMAGLSLTTSNLDGLPVVGLRESPHFGLNVFVKRAMDIVFSALALILISPLLLIIAIAVKTTSAGPIFYRQERCGLNGRKFMMIKFRSMKQNAEAETGPVWAGKEDLRKTKLGSFLRKTSLDELPQFLNVLLGHMSVVGPRPERPDFIEKFRKTIPNYNARHAVKAGITGWAQVNGWRGNTSLRRRIQYDLHYITHWNPLFDLRIIWLTVWNGLINRNAY